jgi:hypothetical protein
MNSHGKALNRPKFVQYCVIAINGVCLLWGLEAIFSILFPGPSGEWAGFAVFAAAIVNIPAGLVTLALGSIIRSSSDRLRRIALISSIVVLLLPVLAGMLWSNRIWLHSFTRSLG